MKTEIIKIGIGRHIDIRCLYYKNLRDRVVEEEKDYIRQCIAKTIAESDLIRYTVDEEKEIVIGELFIEVTEEQYNKIMK